MWPWHVKMATQNLLKLLLLLRLMMRNVSTTVWCRFGRWTLVIKLSFCSDFEDKVSRFVQDFEVDVQARFWSWSLVIILLLMLGCGYEVHSWSRFCFCLVKIFKFKFCRNADVVSIISKWWLHSFCTGELTMILHVTVSVGWWPEFKVVRLLLYQLWEQKQQDEDQIQN